MKYQLFFVLLAIVYCTTAEAQTSAFTCDAKRYAEEHYANPEFNNLIDEACTLINQAKYTDALAKLNKALEVDFAATNDANPFIASQRDKLSEFIAAGGAASSPAPAKEAETVAEAPRETPVITPTEKAAVKPAETQPAPVDEKKSGDDSAAEHQEIPTEATPIETPKAKEVEVVASEPESKPEPQTVKVEIDSPSSPVASDNSQQVTTTEPPANTVSEEENAATAKVSFSNEELQSFQEKGVGKVRELENHIRIIADKSTQTEQALQEIENSLRLFDSEDHYVQVSSLNRPDKPRIKIRKYLDKIRLLSYESVNIEWAEFMYTSDFIKGDDGNYHGYITFRQKFSAMKDNQVVYEDITTKKQEVILKSYDKYLEGTSENQWDVFLGDISVVQTERN